MEKEKMLIKIEEKNLFKKVINLIKNIFSKKQNIEFNQFEMYNKEDSFINKINEERKTLNMQQSLENGKLKETELTEVDKNNLIKLYNEQIKNLEQEIESYKRKLTSYKEKILIAKSKVNN